MVIGVAFYAVIDLLPRFQPRIWSYKNWTLGRHCTVDDLILQVHICRRYF